MSPELPLQIGRKPSIVLLNMRPLPFGFGTTYPSTKWRFLSISITLFDGHWKTYPFSNSMVVPILRFFNRIHKVPTIVVRPYKYLATRFSFVSSFWKNIHCFLLPVYKHLSLKIVTQSRSKENTYPVWTDWKTSIFKKRNRGYIHLIFQGWT